MAERFTPQFRVENTAGGEPNLTREFTPNFNNTNFIYRGVMNTWIGDGDTTTRPENNDAGVLYVEYKDGTIERLGPVSSYAVAVANGFDGTEEEWEAYITSVAVNAQAADERALDAEAWAVGKRDGTDVPSTDDTYHNNSKYYSEQSATSATNAATSESNASESATTAGGYASNALNSKNAAAQSESNAEAWAVGRRGGIDVGVTDETYENNAKYYAGIVAQEASNILDNYTEKTDIYGYMKTSSDKEITDAASYPAQSIIVTMAPKLYNGNFLRYQKIYFGHAGRNILDISSFTTATSNGMTYTNNFNGTVNMGGLTTVETPSVVFAGSMSGGSAKDAVVFPDISQQYKVYSVSVSYGENGNVVTNNIYPGNGISDYSGSNGWINGVRAPDISQNAEYGVFPTLADNPHRVGIKRSNDNNVFNEFHGEEKWINLRPSYASVPYVYGGTYDVAQGVLIITHGYIESYNGEVLPGAWLSNMDTYEPGTVPSTGAEVVYEKANPDAYYLEPLDVIMFEDYNQLWANGWHGDLASTTACPLSITYRPAKGNLNLSVKYSGAVDAIVESKGFLRKDISKEEGPVTITGDSSQESICIKDLVIDSTGSAPAESQHGTSLFFRDKDGDLIGTMHGVHRAEDNVGLFLAGARRVDGTLQYNTLDLTVNNLGNPVVTFNGAATRNAWKTALAYRFGDVADLSGYVTTTSTKQWVRFTFSGVARAIIACFSTVAAGTGLAIASNAGTSSDVISDSIGFSLVSVSSNSISFNIGASSKDVYYWVYMLSGSAPTVSVQSS